MGTDYIIPIIDSVYQVCETELCVAAQRGALSLAAGGGCGVTALVGVTGPLRGTMALTFPGPTALRIAGRLLDAPVDGLDDTAAEAIAGFAASVSRHAKARINLVQDDPTDWSLPVIVRGSHFIIEHQRENHWLEIPFASGLGPFGLRLTLQREWLAAASAVPD